MGTEMKTKGAIEQTAFENDIKEIVKRHTQDIYVSIDRCSQELENLFCKYNKEGKMSNCLNVSLLLAHCNVIGDIIEKAFHEEFSKPNDVYVL